MRTFSVIELGLAVTIIALAGISVVTSLLTKLNLQVLLT